MIMSNRFSFIPNTAITLAFLLLAAGAVRSQTLNERMSAAARRVFGEAATISSGVATLNDKQVTAIRGSSGFGYGTTVNYYAVNLGNRRAGYAIVDEVRGKSKLITYAVFVDPNVVIKDLEVLAYRETYGGEIQYDAFRKQFRGKGTKDAMKVGVDIRNVSGATISTNAVTGGTRKLMAVLRELKAAGTLK